MSNFQTCFFVLSCFCYYSTFDLFDAVAVGRELIDADGRAAGSGIGDRKAEDPAVHHPAIEVKIEPAYISAASGNKILKYIFFLLADGECFCTSKYGTAGTELRNRRAFIGRESRNVDRYCGIFIAFRGGTAVDLQIVFAVGNQFHIFECDVAFSGGCRCAFHLDQFTVAPLPDGDRSVAVAGIGERERIFSAIAGLVEFYEFHRCAEAGKD